jgi:hypothetical protein
VLLKMAKRPAVYSGHGSGRHDRILSANTSRPAEITSEADLLPEGAQPGTMPTDLEQATGLERLEILGKMQGVDIFDMSPLDASRKGTYTKSGKEGRRVTILRGACAV